MEWNGTISLIREENGKVYFIPATDSIEFLLYDFTLEVNDTFIPANSSFSPDELVVESIDSIMTSTGYRKLWTFTSSHSQWIEGIGATEGYVVEPWYLVHPNAASSLSCFGLDSISIIGQNCYNITSSNQSIYQDALIEVFPNPFTDVINVSAEVNDLQISIYNALGYFYNQSQIDLSYISNGVYFLFIRIKDKIKKVKIIKQSY